MFGASLRRVMGYELAAVRCVAVTFAACVAAALLAAAPAYGDLPGVISTVVGDPSVGGPAVGVGQSPYGLAVFGGKVYVADESQNVVRSVDIATGIEAVAAGNGGSGSSGDGGSASAAQVSPFGIGVDRSGDLLIADSIHHRVRFVSASSCDTSCPFGLPSLTTGGIYTIAGDGSPGYAGDDGPGSQAELWAPVAVAADPGGDVLVADGTDQVVRLVAASSCASDCPFGLPSMVAGDIYTVIGGGNQPMGSGLSPRSINLFYPYGLAVDQAGDVFVADNSDSTEDRVGMVAAASCSTGCPFGVATTSGDIYPIAGGGLVSGGGDGGPATSAYIVPNGIAVDTSGDLLLSDGAEKSVRLVAQADCSSACPFGLGSMKSGYIYRVAGGGASSPGDGGPALAAVLSTPGGIAIGDSDQLLIAGAAGNTVRLVAATSCGIDCAFGLASTVADDIYTVAGNGSLGYSGDGGPALAAELADAQGIAVDTLGDYLVADTGDNVVRLVAARDCSSDCPYGLGSMSSGDIYTVAGTGAFAFSGAGGPARAAALASPEGVAVDSRGDLLIADSLTNRVRLVAAQDCSTACPYGLSATVTGDIYTLAGTGGDGFSGDGSPANVATLTNPTGLATDPQGDVLIADSGNDRVRLVAAQNCSGACPYGLTSMTTGYIYTIAGSGGFAITSGVPATSSAIGSPRDIAVRPDGGLIVAGGDGTDGLVQLVSDTDCASVCPYGLSSTRNGDIYTLGARGDGQGVAVDGLGDILLTTDSGTQLQLFAAVPCSANCPYGLPVMNAGTSYTLINSAATPGFAGDGGDGQSAEIASAAALSPTPAGDLLIADAGDNRIRLLAGGAAAAGAPVSGTPPTIHGTSTAGTTLTATPGGWAGVIPQTYIYQWTLNGSPIVGATSSAYQTSVQQAGDRLSVEVTATNAVGHTTTTSQAVTLAAPSNQPPPLISPLTTVTSVATPTYSAAAASIPPVLWGLTIEGTSNNGTRALALRDRHQASPLIITYHDTEAAVTTIVLRSLVRAPCHRHEPTKLCWRAIRLGSLIHADQRGKNRFQVPPQLRRRLDQPGTYQLIAFATNRNRQISQPAKARFQLRP